MTNLLWAVALGVAVIGGWFVVTNVNTSSPGAPQDVPSMVKEKEMAQQVVDDAVMKKEEAMKDAMGEDASMMKKDDAMMADDKKMMEDEPMKKDAMTGEGEMKKDTMPASGDAMKPGMYVAYDAAKLAMANSGDVVLFFRASWCPTCQAVDKNIKANASKIPGSLTILDVNYDSSAELKKKYGVTYQHTFVQVDAAGAMIKKWSGSPTLAALVAEVN
jgi:thiol-disulfide isomerase/thioredoxin